MPNPNKTVGNFRRGRTWIDVVSETFPRQGKAEARATELRATKLYGKVLVGSYKIGPRAAPVYMHTVRAYVHCDKLDAYHAAMGGDA